MFVVRVEVCVRIPGAEVELRFSLASAISRISLPPLSLASLTSLAKTRLEIHGTSYITLHE